MKQIHKNFWNMVKDTVAFFLDNTPKWTNIPILKTNVDKLKDVESQIAQADKTQQEKNPSGNTTQKDKQLLVLLKAAFKLGSKLTSYALEVKDQTLLPLVNFSLTQLEEGNESDIISRCQVIADKATLLLPMLSDYNVTATSIAAFQDEIDKFKNMTPERNLVVNARKVIVKTIPELIGDAREILEKLDNNVNGFIDDETFIMGYHNIRSINSRRGSRNTTSTIKPATAK